MLRLFFLWSLAPTRKCREACLISSTERVRRRLVFLVTHRQGAETKQPPNVFWWLFYLNKSACVPVLVNSRISSVSFCCQTNSQSGCKWHSQRPLYLPANLWGLYVAGNVPVSASNVTAFLKIDKS